MLDRAVRLSKRIGAACVCGSAGVDDVDAKGGAAACDNSKACRASDGCERGGASACCGASVKLVEEV